MFEELSESYEMSDEAGELLRKLSEPRPVGDSVKSAIARAARRLRWSYTRTKAIWYAEARRIDASEMDQLRAEARQQASRYSAIAHALQAVDPNMHQHDIIALLGAARKLGSED